METKIQRSANVCRCDHHVPALRIVRSVGFNQELARKVSALDLGGDATVDLIMTELLDCHTGHLFGMDGEPIELNSDKPADIKRWDRLFSEDQRRTINRYKDRAVRSEFKNRLQERMTDSIVMIHLALAIRECRLSGACAVR